MYLPVLLCIDILLTCIDVQSMCCVVESVLDRWVTKDEDEDEFRTQNRMSGEDEADEGWESSLLDASDSVSLADTYRLNHISNYV